MEHLNRAAVELVDEAIDFADELAVQVHDLSGDAAVQDAGVAVPGGREVGLLLVEIQTAGLATVTSDLAPVAGATLPHVEVATDQPALALLCSQKGGWELDVDGFEGLGSGPARALVAEEDVFRRVGYQDAADFAVLTVETSELPDEAVAASVAERAGVPESAVFLPSYAAASITGSVVGAARVAELAAYRLFETGYDPAAILSAGGRAPVPPVAASEPAAIARTTDAVAYGGRAHLTVEDPVEDPEAIASVAAEEYGRPLGEVFEEADWAFADLPVEAFAPAQVTIDVLGGPTHVVGDVHEDVLAESFDLPG